ncbi:MAG TPA: glycerophosphoryl diester phosphodiesterase membrane domain-containing protein [Erysipelothrix sp.]
MKNKLNNLVTQTQESFTLSIVPVLFFELVFNVSLLLLIKPAFKAFIKLLLMLSGKTILLNEEIKNYIFSGVGFVSLLLIFFIAVIIIFYEFAVIFKLIDASQQKETASLKQILKEAFSSLRLLFDPRFLILGFYFILLIPILSMGVNSSLIPQLIIPNFITDEIYKYPGGNALIIILSLIAMMLFVRFLFSLPFMILDNYSIKEASKASKKVTKGKIYQYSAIIFLIIMAWSGLAMLPYYLSRQFTSLISSVLALGFTAIYFFLTLSLSPFILNFIYVIYQKDKQTRKNKKTLFNFATIKKQSIHYSKALKRDGIKYRWPLLFLGVLLLLNTLPLSHDGIDYVPSQEPLVIGHRGSLLGVENTVEAVNAASDMGAHYAEIDILLSKDHVPMVIHDNNLTRLTKKNLRIANMTSEEIQNLTIKSHGYEGQIIPLERFVQEIDPNISLLIELKSHGKESESIAEQMMLALEGVNPERYLYQTAEFDLLLEMKEKYPRLDLGYIIIGKVGWLSSDVIASIPADFLVFEESLISQRLIDNVHRNNKAVFAWTINQKETVAEFYQLGVDGIISDYPDMVKAIQAEFIK